MLRIQGFLSSRRKCIQSGCSNLESFPSMFSSACATPPNDIFIIGGRSQGDGNIGQRKAETEMKAGLTTCWTYSSFCSLSCEVEEEKQSKSKWRPRDLNQTCSSYMAC